ncbi:hypothetical protein [Adhaeribacter aquaticus]|uniref:hypothetical protein n=1 Tax=Adhaeribacter aquaticus TaxID=299567 RepID=UPI00047E213E|nr:hypothetical protein [Adhaeribacter aquaticus]
MKINLTSLILALFFLASCEKNASDTEPKPEPKSEPNYMPMTAGSTWSYQTSLGTSYTLTATNKDTTASGKTFKVFTSTDGQNRYRLKSANEYYQLTVIPGLAPNGFSELYLKDNQPVKATWKSSLPISIPSIPIPLTADLNYAIKTKDTTLTVNNKIFTKVIRVRLNVSIPTIGSLGGGDFYYADKVGLVQSNFNLSLQGSKIVNQSETLTNYTIK